MPVKELPKLSVGGVKGSYRPDCPWAGTGLDALRLEVDLASRRPDELGSIAALMCVLEVGAGGYSMWDGGPASGLTREEENVYNHEDPLSRNDPSCLECLKAHTAEAS